MDSTVTVTEPPEWLSLPEAREAIKRHYGKDAMEIIDRLREMLPEGFPHRIAGWIVRHRQWSWREMPFAAGYDSRRMPAWLAEDRHGYVRVQNWQLAQVDWAEGTVLNMGGHRSPIEVRWVHITEWVRTGGIGDTEASQRSHHAEAKRSPPATLGLPPLSEITAFQDGDLSGDSVGARGTPRPVTPPTLVVQGEHESQPPAKSPRRQRSRGSSSGGRTPHPAVQAVKLELATKLGAEGVPQPGDGVQATLERWFIQAVESRRGTISEARARVHVQRAIKAARIAQSP